MWPRANVDIYVHMEFELPERFYSPESMGAFQHVRRDVDLFELLTYTAGLFTFPKIIARIFMDKSSAWLIFQFKDCEQFSDFCCQIEEEKQGGRN